MNTFTAKRIRRGIEVARSGPSDIIHFPFTPFSRALKHENATQVMMNKLLTGDERTEYSGRVISGMFGFMNEQTRQAILTTENKYRRLARKELGYKK
jgi:hypothetical protein